MNTHHQANRIIRHAQHGDFTVAITRGDIVAGRAGWVYSIYNADFRLVRQSWTAGPRRDAELMAARDVRDLTSQAMVDEFEEPTRVWARLEEVA